MKKVAEAIVDHLRPLIGLKLSVARRSADMRIFHFDKNGPIESGSVGE